MKLFMYNFESWVLKFEFFNGENIIVWCLIGLKLLIEFSKGLIEHMIHNYTLIECTRNLNR